MLYIYNIMRGGGRVNSRFVLHTICKQCVSRYQTKFAQDQYSSKPQQLNIVL